MEDAHTRYAIKRGNEYVGHRQQGKGGKSFARLGTFDHARIWARKGDAQRYALKSEVVVEVTVAEGTPWCIMTEG